MRLPKFKKSSNLKVGVQGVIAVLLLTLSSCIFVNRAPTVPLNRDRKANVFRGVYHVHTEFSHDSKAPLELVIKTAEQAGLDFVVITDHNNMDAVRPYQKMNKPKRPLLIIGDEISTWHDGHLGTIGIQKEPPNVEHTQDTVGWIHEAGGYAIPAHPFSLRKPWTNWKIKNFDGVEIFSLSDIFYAEDPKMLLMKAFFLPPRAFLKSVLKTPEPALKLWDEQLRSGRHVAAFGSIDAHLKQLWHGFHVENYLLYFQAVTMYVFADEFKEEKLIEALGRGRSFIAFEVYGLAQDFSFLAAVGNQTYGSGDSIAKTSSISLTIKTPEQADIRLIHNGQIIEQTTGTVLEYQASESGYYRVEVYLEGKLWIVSNPIYVEA